MEILYKISQKIIILIHKLLNYRLYKNGVILFGVPTLINRNTIKIEKDARINQNVTLQGDGGITIGKGVTLSRNVSIISTGYDTNNWETNKKIKAHINAPIIIGDYTWIGANALILQGVSIASGCIVGAGSIVIKDLENKNSLYAGNPAKFIKHLY